MKIIPVLNRQGGVGATSFAPCAALLMLQRQKADDNRRGRCCCDPRETVFCLQPQAA